MGLEQLVPPSPYNANQNYNYDAPLAMTGISGLIQGLSQGAMMSKKMEMHEKQMANETAWRNAMIGSREERVGEQARHNQEMEALQKKLAELKVPPAQPILSDDKKFLLEGGMWKPIPQPKAGTVQPTEKALHSAAAAYQAIDDYDKIAKSYLPGSSAVGGALSSVPEIFQAALSQTSGPNNLADKAGQVATMYATAVNSMGGGRMSEAEIENMKRAIGGRAIGETYKNISAKHEDLKNELAIKMGVTRSEIEKYMANLTAPGSDVQKQGNMVKGIPRSVGGMTRIRASDGTLHDIPSANIDAARKVDPGLTVQ